MYNNFLYSGVVSNKLHSIFPNPNYCAQPNEMPSFPENCLYFTRSPDELEAIEPKYPCMRCKFGFSGKIVDMVVPLSFPSSTHEDCQISISSCDLDFTDLQGADIRYDQNVLFDSNFLAQKFFSCNKCLDGKIPVATLFHDSSNNAFYYKKHDSATFDQTTITTEGMSVVCRSPSLSQEFGLAASDPDFDLDANCSLAVIDLSQAVISSTKTENRYEHGNL